MNARNRYTDGWPSVEMILQYPNWVFAWEEGRRGQDETTIKPATQQQFLSEDVAYTAGDAWFPNGDSCPVLIQLHDYQPVGIVVYEQGRCWEISYDCDADRWTPSTLNSPPVEFDDSRRFPLRFTSSLPESRKLDEIRRVISPEGFAQEWIAEEW